MAWSSRMRLPATLPTRPASSTSMRWSGRTTTSGPTRPTPPSGSPSAPPAIAVRRSVAPSTRPTSSRSTEAICRYRASRGYTGPLFIGRDTHALSEPAERTALEVLAANGVDVRVDAADGVHADAGHLARDPRRTTGRPASRRRPTASSSRRRTTRPRTAASSTTRPTAARPTPTSRGWIQDEANRLLEAPGRGHRRLPRVPDRAGARGGRPATTSSAPTSTTSRSVVDMEAIAAPGCASASTRWAAPRSPTGARSASAMAST